MTNRSEDDFFFFFKSIEEKYNKFYEIPSQITLKVYYILNVHRSTWLLVLFSSYSDEEKEWNRLKNAENTKNDQFKTNDSLSDTCALDCCRFFIFDSIYYHSKQQHFTYELVMICARCIQYTVYEQVEGVWRFKWEIMCAVRMWNGCCARELLRLSNCKMTELHANLYDAIIWVFKKHILKYDVWWWIAVHSERNTRIEQMNNFIEYRTKNRVSSQNKNNKI